MAAAVAWVCDNDIQGIVIMWWIFGAVYALVGVLFFLLLRDQNDLDGRNCFPLWSRIVASALWPLTCVGGFVFILLLFGDYRSKG